MAIPGVSLRNLSRLVHHLREYVELGPQRLHAPFCPKGLGRLLARVEAAAARKHKTDTEAGKNELLANAGQVLSPSAGRRRSGGGRQASRRRRGGVVGRAPALASPTSPMPFAVADEFGWSAEMLHYSPRKRLSLLDKYARPPWSRVAKNASALWRRAAVAIDRLEGLAHEIGRRADAADGARIGSASRFHAVEAKQIARWNVLTLLNEFDMTSNSVRAYLATIFVRFHDVLEWRGEGYVGRIARTKARLRQVTAGGGREW